MSVGSLTRSIAYVELALGRVDVRLVRDVGPRDERLPVFGADEVEVRERPGDVRVRLAAEVADVGLALLLEIVGVKEELHELPRRELVTLLLEERPGVLVERDAVERWLLVDERVLIGGCRAVQVPHGDGLVTDDTAAWIELVELPVADLPPDLGDVLRVLTGSERRLGNRGAIIRVRIDEHRLRVPLLDLLWELIALAPRSPVLGRLVLRERDDGVDVDVLRVRRRRIRILVVADERAPNLLRLLDARRVVERMTEVVVNPGELPVVREALDHLLVERNGRLQADRDVVFRIVRARALLIECSQPVHGIRRGFGLRVRARILRDEVLETLNGDLARLAQLLFLGVDLLVEAAEDGLLLFLVVELDDRRDGIAVVLCALGVRVRLFGQAPERSDLLGCGGRRGWRSSSERAQWRRERGRGCGRRGRRGCVTRGGRRGPTIFRRGRDASVRHLLLCKPGQGRTERHRDDGSRKDSRPSHGSYFDPPPGDSLEGCSPESSRTSLSSSSRSWSWRDRSV